MDKPFLPTCRPFQLSFSGAYQDHNLVESISEDDRATLLPIIKIAFPFLKYQMLDPFPTCEVDGNMGRVVGIMQMDGSHIPSTGMEGIIHENQLENSRLNFIPNEYGITQMDGQHSSSSGRDGSTHEHQVENALYNSIQNVDDIMQMDDSHSPSSMGTDASKHEHKMESLQYNLIPPVPLTAACGIHSRQQHVVESLQPKSWQPGEIWGRACKLEKVETPSSKEELLLTQSAVPEASSTITDDKLSLSLVSTPSEADLQRSAAPSMMNLMGYLSPEASWMQVQGDPSYDEGSEMAYVGHFGNPSSDSGSLLSRSTECSNAVDQPHAKAYSGSMPAVASEPKGSADLACGHHRGERTQNPSLANTVDLNNCVGHKSPEINGKPRDVISEVVGRAKRHEAAGQNGVHVGHKRKYDLACTTGYEPGSKGRRVSGHTADGHPRITQVVSLLSAENTQEWLNAPLADALSLLLLERGTHSVTVCEALKLLLKQGHAKLFIKNGQPRAVQVKMAFRRCPDIRELKSSKYVFRKHRRAKGKNQIVKGNTDNPSRNDIKQCRLESSFSNKAPCQSLLAVKGCSDELTSDHVASTGDLDPTVKGHKPEKCRRSNGKQWRCSQNAIPGMLYCELHYNYNNRRKARMKDYPSPDKTSCPDIQGQKFQTPDNVQEDSQKVADRSLGQRREPSLKIRQLDILRCRRSDGKLWQCSRQVMPGSIYCVHHHHRRRKKGKKQDSGFAAARKTNREVQVRQAWAVDNSINISNGDSIDAHGQVSVSVRDVSGLSQSAVWTSQIDYKGEGHVQAHYGIAVETKQEMHVSKVCGGSMPISMQASESKQNGCGRAAMRFLQMAAGERATHGWKGKTNLHGHACSAQASLCMSGSEGKESVNGYGGFIEESGSKQVIQAVREASSLVEWNAGCPGDTGVDDQGKESGLLERCGRKDGKQWQCSQLCKPGFVYCERHRGRQQEGRAVVSGQMNSEKPENPPAIGVDAKGFPHKLDGEGCFANNVHGRVQVHKETPQMNDCAQDVGAEVYLLKQCQRKDGKGWQCSQHAKHGFNYCEHHLVYLSRRSGSKSSRKENKGLHKVATEHQKLEISTAHEPSLGSNASPSAAYGIQKREISTAPEPVLGTIAHPLAACSMRKQVICTAYEPLPDRIAFPSAAPIQKIQIITGHEPLLGSIATSSIQKQEISTSHEAVLPHEPPPSAGHSIQKQAFTTAHEPVLGNIASPSAAHNIYKQEMGTVCKPLLGCIACASAAGSIQKEEISTSHEPLLGSKAYPSAVHGVQKQRICTAYEPLLAGGFAYPSASPNIQKQGIYTAYEPILGNTAYPSAAHTIQWCKDPKTHGASLPVKSWSEMLSMGYGSDSDE